MSRWSLQLAFFCLSNSPKPKDIWFTVTLDKEKQQILTIEKQDSWVIVLKSEDSGWYSGPFQQPPSYL